MSIRNGEYMYGDGMRVKPEFYELLKDVQEKYRHAVEHTVLPKDANVKAISNVLEEIYQKRFFSNDKFRIRESEMER